MKKSRNNRNGFMKGHFLLHNKLRELVDKGDGQGNA